MNVKNLVKSIISHSLVGGMGFAAGIYALPILTAPEAPDLKMLENASKTSMYQATFQRNLKGSDFLHWGEGVVSLSPESITFKGELSPGPDFKLYLSPRFVETEAEFEQYKSQMVQVGDVKTFNNFAVPMNANIKLSNYSTVIVWCESFGEFITAAKYQ